MKVACSKTPQSQVSEEKARKATAATTDAKQAQLQAQSKARHMDDYCATLKLILVILNMIKPNSHYSRGQKEYSNQTGLDIPNNEEPTTAAQPQGGGQHVQRDRGEG